MPRLLLSKRPWHGLDVLPFYLVRFGHRVSPNEPLRLAAGRNETQGVGGLLPSFTPCLRGIFVQLTPGQANGISKRNTDGVLVLDLLSRDGFINRRENPEDGRFCLIHLTTKGIRFRPCQCQTRNEAFRQPRSSRRMRVTPPQTKGSNRMKHGKITQTDRF